MPARKIKPAENNLPKPRRKRTTQSAPDPEPSPGATMSDPSNSATAVTKPTQTEPAVPAEVVRTRMPLTRELPSGAEAVNDRRRKMGDLLADALDMARRNPAAVAVGVAIAGFLLARVMQPVIIIRTVPEDFSASRHQRQV